MDDVKTILRNYMRSKKAVRDIDTFGAAQNYAEKLGNILADAIGTDFEDIAEEDLALVLRSVLKRAYDDSAVAAASAQYRQNQKAKLGIGTLRAEFDPADADKVAEELAGKIAAPGLVENLIKQSTIGAVDETIRRNAEAREEMGLDVSIVRTYSDVGLRAGTKYSEDCEWCLERCGEWDNYKDAKDAGCFERHPGCLCMIDYHVGRTHSVSTGGSWVNI
jgi:hypothetical protein